MAGQREMPAIPKDMPIITLGNPDASNTITMVSNPLRSPCAHMHARVEKMLSENENLKCEVIFISSTHENDPGGKFVSKLFTLPFDVQAEGLHSWFEKNDKNFEKWNLNYDDSKNGDQNNNIQAQHLNWADAAEVQSTPTLFFNDKKLPSVIKLEDISYQFFNGSN
jgi:protein-disulfide isomerase